MSELKKRGKNFNDFEKTLVIELVKEKIDIIENKKTDAVSTKDKEKAWAEICVSYNLAAQTGQRTPSQLHGLYLTLKKKAKKDKANDRVEMYKTGGGTYSPSIDSIGEKIVGMLIPQFEPLPNPFDSSAPLYNENEGTDNEIQAECSILEMYEVGTQPEEEPLCSPSTSKSVESIQQPTAPGTSKHKTSTESAPRKRKSSSMGSTTDFINVVSKRKESKTDFDRQLFEKRLQILNTELETKKNNLEYSKLQIEHAKMQIAILKSQNPEILF